MQGPTDIQPAGDDQHLSALPTGTRIGKYELRGILGESWFAITYQARDTHLNRDVAIKEYFPSMLAVRHGGTQVLPRSPRVADDFTWGRDLFLEEARTLALLERASAVVTVHDFMEVNGTAYMVMAFVHGETLEDRLRRDGPLSQAATERLLRPMLDGLEKVHAKGHLHRDIKPSNICLDEDGLPVLLDFGTARAAVAARTQDLTAVFTPGYAPPEQAMAENLGPWSDIYALAATLYRCVTGDPPANAIRRLRKDMLVPAAEARRGRHAAALLAGIDAGLIVESAARPQSIAEWRTVFDTGAFNRRAAPAPMEEAAPTITAPAAPEPVAAHARTTIAGRRTVTGTKRPSSTTAADQQPRNRNWLLWAVPVVLLLALAALFGVDRDRSTLTVDQGTSRIDRVAGSSGQTAIVITGDIVNPGHSEAMATRLHLSFRDTQDKVVAERTVPIGIGKVPPNGRARFEVRLDDAPLNAAKVDIAVE